MITHALDLARRGFAVFPLRGKVPISAAITYVHATSDETVVEAWWRKNPNANIGLCPARSGLIVLDIDKKNGGLETLAALETKHGPITTLTVNTGGGGKHFYFRAPSGCTISRVIGALPGTDILHDGGHVVAPPSSHPSGTPYAFADEGAVILDAPAWLLELAAKSERAEQPAAVLPTQRGELSRRTLKFLTVGIKNGEWNDELYYAARDAHQNGYPQEEFEAFASKITGHLDDNDLKAVNSGYGKVPRHEARSPKNTQLLELISSCHFVQNLHDGGEYLFVELASGAAHNYDQNVIRGLMGKEAFGEYLKARKVTAEFDYQPSAKLLSTNERGVDVYNRYSPPKWRQAFYLEGTPVETLPTVPPLYAEFFNHLVDGHSESYEYLLDWLATSLTGRNWTILAAIGEQGIGKGVLGEIMRAMHGEANHVRAKDNLFKSKFNSPLAYKTIVHIDEIDLNTKESMDRIKDVVNADIEIERKGADPIFIRNHASFYIASNSLDAIKLEPGDRRFSIIQLTDTPLRKTELMARVNEYTDEANCALLARHLVGRAVTRSMLEPFKSQRYLDVKEAGLAQWEEYVVETWAPANAGKSVPMHEIQNEIRKGSGLFQAPGRTKLALLARKYPEVLRWARSKSSWKMVSLCKPN